MYKTVKCLIRDHPVAEIAVGQKKVVILETLETTAAGLANKIAPPAGIHQMATGPAFGQGSHWPVYCLDTDNKLAGINIKYTRLPADGAVHGTPNTANHTKTDS